MGFKVGDRIEVINNIGNGPFFNIGDRGTIIAIHKMFVEVKFDIPKKYDGCWGVHRHHIKKIEEEFTFQEVIARIKPGEVYVCVGIGIERIESIEKTHNNDIKIICNNSGLPNGLGIRGTTKFKLQDSKKHTWIYKVEHQKNGKHYDFISSQLLQDDEFVVCDTCKGESYGRVAEIISKELTETEISKYKECWRA